MKENPLTQKKVPRGRLLAGTFLHTGGWGIYGKQILPVETGPGYGIREGQEG